MNRGLCLSNLVVTGQAGLIVTRMDLRIEPGQTVALVGESGSGKTTVGRAAIGLLPIKEGKIEIVGTDISHATQKDLFAIRRHTGIVFQDPASSLNPRLPIGESIGEPIFLAGLAKGESLNTMIEDLLDGTKTGPIASEVNDIVGGFERWGGLRSRTNVGSNARTKAGVAGRIISSERSRKALEKLGIDEDRAEAVQLLGEMAAAFSISGPAGMGSVLARRAGRDVADFGLAEAVERGWMSQATADKVAKRMLDRVAPEGLPEDIKDIIEKGKDAVTSDESKARAAELLDTIRETVRSGGMQRLVDSAKQKTRVLTDIAKERGRELAADKLREARDRAREMAQERASELADEAMGALRERGKEAAGRLVGRFARRGGK